MTMLGFSGSDMSNDELAAFGLRLTAMWCDRTTAVVAVAGDLDLASAGGLVQRLSSTLAVARVRRLVIDLAEVRFLDARGIAALLAIHRQGAAGGVAVTVINCQSMPRRVLEIAGAYKILTGGVR
jgi:anti-anti-sigma factor